MNTKTRWLALPLLALTLAACGSSDEGSDSESSAGSSNGASDKGALDSSDALSKEELIAEADKICQDAGARVLALPKPKTLPEVQKYTADAAKTTDESVAKLKGLTPDDATKADYEAFLTIAETVTKQARKVVTATSSQNSGEVQAALASVVKQGAESRRLAQKIGFKKCGVNAITGLPAGATGAPGATEAPEAPVTP